MERGTILVVEDNFAIRTSLRFTLELEGYKTFLAANGKEGLEILHHIPHPNLILLDLMMPVMNGHEFLEEIEKDSGLMGIPIVIVTAHASEAPKVKGRPLIKKPVVLNDLLNVVKSYCH